VLDPQEWHFSSALENAILSETQQDLVSSIAARDSLDAQPRDSFCQDMDMLATTNEFAVALEQRRQTGGGTGVQLSPEAKGQLLRWYNGNPYDSSPASVEKALDVLGWCEEVSDLDLYPPSLRHDTVEAGSSNFGLPVERITKLYTSYVTLLCGRRRAPIFVAFEGIDGSGKSKHLAKLEQELTTSGARVKSFSFPEYNGFFGEELGRLLVGDHPLGADQLDSKSMALWYAMDRWNALKDERLEQFDFVLLNRFTLSSAVYQSVRVHTGLPNDFVNWIFELEQTRIGLPAPDLYLVLDVSPDVSQKNVRRKGFREYSGKKLDVYEQSTELLRAARARYLELARRLPCIEIIDCMTKHGKMKSYDEVHGAVLECLNRYEMLNTTR
jgi:dTMP kinase